MTEPRRERKVVTVVFCDLVGFTSQAETLDPEDVEAILRPYHERVRRELERHGGTVEKFIGDAVVALFGAPTAHEDDPERAVRAALAIREFAIEEGLELRVGITTGEALVRLDASPEAGEGMASGDVVNTAARLQTGAPSNGILVDDTTYRATRHAVTFDPPQTIQAKGKSKPVAVRRVLEARSRFGVDVAHEARSPLVGRERELGIVRDAFERARHERTPQLLTLVGVPGIGKSRLVYELSQLVDADPEIITWRQGRCLAYGDGVTLWALAEIVKAQAGISEQDAPSEVAEKLRRAASDVLPAADAAWVESHLLALAGLAEQEEFGGNRRNEAFSAWRRFLEGLADQRPLVLVFEDLHWADESLLDFVDELVDWLTDVPLLVVATARPELLERRANWGGGKLNAATVALAPLTDEQTAELIGSALGSPVLPAATQDALLERAGGNPLYAEQFVELYVERGSTDELPLPETLHGIIAARLDRLAAEEKTLVLDAAVVGKVFWTGALGRESDPASAFLSLERKGFVRRQRRSSVEGEAELAFAHALVRDVAYGQIPRGDRAAKHRRVAEWIDSLGRPEDHAEMRAYHWRSALDLSRASGTDDDELLTKARLALRDAGDRAFGLNNHAAAAALYEDALDLWPAEDSERPELLFRHARALHYGFDARREAALGSARDALVEVGDTELAAEAESLLALVAWYAGHGEAARDHLVQAAELAGDATSPAAARVLAVAARIREIASDHDEARPLAEAALAMADELGLDEIRAHALTTIGMAKNSVGDTSGTADMERARALALEIESSVAGPIVNNLAVEAFMQGDLPRAEELYAESIRISLRLGDRESAAFTNANLVWMAFFRGNWDAAYQAADDFIAACEAGAPNLTEYAMRIIRGGIRLARGDLDGARDDHLRSVELARAGQDPNDIVAALSAYASTLLARGELTEARVFAEEVVRLVEGRAFGGAVELSANALRLGIREEMLAALDANPVQRYVVWREGIRMALAGDLVGAAELGARTGNVSWEARMRLSGGEQLLEQGRRSEGKAQMEKALEFYRSVGATFFVEQAERQLAEAQRPSA